MTPAPGPLAPLIQKLSCRLQIEDNVRMAAEENLIIAQADQKIAEGKVDRIQSQLSDTAKQLAWYASYEKGIAQLIDKVCVRNSRGLKPMADLCGPQHH